VVKLETTRRPAVESNVVPQSLSPAGQQTFSTRKAALLPQYFTAPSGEQTSGCSSGFCDEERAFGEAFEGGSGAVPESESDLLQLRRAGAARMRSLAPTRGPEDANMLVSFSAGRCDQQPRAALLVPRELPRLGVWLRSCAKRSASASQGGIREGAHCGLHMTIHRHH
jgi:hypothetical protein